MRIFRLLLAFLCLGLPLAPAAAQTPEERAQLEWVVARGQLLFELDRAAWVGTDDLLERLPNAGALGARGYIVERDGLAYVVTFFGGPADRPLAYYRGRVENRRVVSREIFEADERPTLTPFQRRLADVRGMVARLGRRPCGNRAFNTAVIPPETPDGPIDLYLLTPQVEQGVFPLGGHYRFTIAADSSVQSSREFTRSCIAFDTRAVPRDGTPEAMMVTHLLDPVPTEIHVFSSITSQLPIYVLAEGRTWAVEGSQIRLVEQQTPPPKS